MRVFPEQASGINENRQPLQHLLTRAEPHEFPRLLIEYPDRCGYRYVERHLNSHGVTMESTHVKAAKTSQEELTEDLRTIITVVSARLYGKLARVSSENQKTDDRDERR